MEIDHPKLQAAYEAKINKICDDREDKSHFSIPEIASIVADLLHTGEFYVGPQKSSTKELFAARKKLSPEWSKETSDFVDELYSRLEWAETEVEVFNLRLKKQWTAGSNLYSQKEVDALVEAEYSIGFDNGQSAKSEQAPKPANCSHLTRKSLDALIDDYIDIEMVFIGPKPSHRLKICAEDLQLKVQSSEFSIGPRNSMRMEFFCQNLQYSAEPVRNASES